MEFNPRSKARYWVGVLYNENMVDNWQTDIGDLIQVPYAYCIHDKDTLSDHAEDRKVHTHLLIAFPNTTTYKHAMTVFNLLSAEGKRAINTCEMVVSVKNMYDYLIHDTETSRKKKKHLYDVSERIEGNNFDIGAFEQLSIADKQSIRRELSLLVIEKQFSNYFDLYSYVISNYDNVYEDILCSYSGHFERLTKGRYHIDMNEAREKERNQLKHRHVRLNTPKLKKRK